MSKQLIAERLAHQRQMDAAKRENAALPAEVGPSRQVPDTQVRSLPKFESQAGHGLQWDQLGCLGQASRPRHQPTFSESTCYRNRVTINDVSDYTAALDHVCGMAETRSVTSFVFADHQPGGRFLRDETDGGSESQISPEGGRVLSSSSYSFSERVELVPVD